MSTLIFGTSLCQNLKIPYSRIETYLGYTLEQLVKLDLLGLPLFLKEDGLLNSHR